MDDKLTAQQIENLRKYEEDIENAAKREKFMEPIRKEGERRDAEIYELKQKICEIGKRLWQLGFVAGNDGNISVKYDNDTILTTPTGVSKGDMIPGRCERNSILEIFNDINYDPKNYLIRPSSEIKMHLRCYELRSDIGAVVHAHPPFATAFAAANIPLDNDILTEAVMLLGPVLVAPYATPGSDDVPEVIAPFIKEHNAVLLANHGALTVGADLDEAYYRMEVLEHVAKTTFITRLLGGGQAIPPEKVSELSELGMNFTMRKL